VIGDRPVHVPWLASRVLPATADPEIVGSTAFRGPADVIVTVGFEAAVAEPEPLLAVTRTRRRNPMSASLSVYPRPFAPEIGAQFDPSGSPPSAPQRTHL
jgi:hypothetical protein